MSRTQRVPVLPTTVLALGVAAVSLAGSGTQARLAAQDLPEGVTRGPTVEGITEYSLDNGLRVLLFPDQSKQQITVNITYLVGSRHEAYGETGMAHLLEHLVFKGTPDHPDIPAELTEHGAFPNGTTWFDRTNYFETFPATEENLEWALDLEADRMVNSFISKEDLDSEMTVVRNEWESGENNPINVVLKRLQSVSYDWHNYGNSTIGARADIENVPIERLQAFYRKYYQPDNAILVVAGRFDPAHALELVAEKFGPLPRPDRSGDNTLFETYTAEPAQDGERQVTLRRVGDVQIVAALYHVPPGSHEDFAAVDVLTHLLVTEPSGRLYQALVEPGLAASQIGLNFQLREPGMLIVGAQVREEQPIEPATEALLAVMDGFEEQPPTAEEVDRARTDLLKNIELAFNNPQGIALQLSEWASMGDWRLLFIHRDRIEQVTPEDVARVAHAYLLPSNRSLAFYRPVDETPRRAEIPAAPDIAALVDGYAGREAVAEGEAFDPSPANIDARTTRLEFENGFQLALTPKENRGEAVNVSFSFRFGTEDELMGQATAGSMAASMLRRGTEQRSRQEIEDELDRLKAQLSLGGSATIVSGQIQTVRENLPDVLALLDEILKQPSFPAGEFQTLKQEQLAGLESQRSDPQARAVSALQRHLNPFPENHPNYVPTFDEAVARIEASTVEEARAFWARFYGAQGGTMSVVGDFDADRIEALVRERFEGWTAEAAYARVPSPYYEPETVELDIETPDKANAMMLAVQPVRMTDQHPDYPAMVIANYMLGGGFLNSRLATRIRQQEGLSYGVGSQFAVHPIDDSGAFLTFAILAPENADKVVEAFRDEIRKVLEEGFTAEELEAARRGYLDSQQNGRANDGAVASQLNGQLFFGRTYEFTAEQEAAIRALTVEQVNEAFARHIDPGKISIIRAGDFSGKATS